jgi:hypothetical protein
MVNWIRSNRLTLIVFFIFAFRPQILYSFRVHILRPAVRIFQQPSRPAAIVLCTTSSDEDDGSGDDDEGCVTEDESEYYSDDSSSDGCTDEDDSCAEPADDESDEPSDGCSDDGSCAAESDASYEYDDSYYADEGCSCTGETVVGGTPIPSVPKYSTLEIQFQFSRMHEAELRITDLSDQTLVILAPGRTFYGSGSYWFSWNGNLPDGQWAGYGSYRAVLTLDRVRTSSRSFSYSQERGFLVDTDNIMVFSDGTGKISDHMPSERLHLAVATDPAAPRFRN